MIPEHQHHQQQQQQQQQRLPIPDDEEEQVPSPRSVAMTTSITRAFTTTSTTVQAAAAYHHKPFLGKQRSWPLSEQDYRSSSTTNCHTTTTATTTATTTTITPTPTTRSSRMNDTTTACHPKHLIWKDLHPLPAYAELRLHLHLTTLPLETVLTRILRWMRLQSICGKSRLESESYLDCSWTTLCHEASSDGPRRVHFVIYLWRVDPDETKPNPNDHDNNNNNKNDSNNEKDSVQTIAVQLDRRSGCAVLTQRLRRCLIHYLQQQQQQQNQNQKTLLRAQQEQEQQLQRVVCAKIKRLLADQEKQQQVASDGPAPDTTTTTFRQHGRYYHCETMARCLSLLNSDCRDERQMGMETLVCLTDPSVTTRETAEQIAEALILECRPRSNQFRFIRLHVLSYVQKREKKRHHNHSHDLPTTQLNHRQNDDNNDNNEDDEDDLSVAAFAEENHAAVMHSLALKVVSNALQTLVNSKTYSQQPAIPEQPQPIFLEHSNVWCTVVRSLARDIKDVAQCPQDAALAAKCLFLLSNLFPDAAVNLLMVKDKLMPQLLVAQKYGEERHCVLEQEVRNLIVQLGGLTNSSIATCTNKQEPEDL